MSETAIRVTNITKEYTIDYSHTGSFKELVMRKLFHARQYQTVNSKNISALDNISFEVKKGEALGIIGKNGAGKSTLLKVLSGITRPTSGEIEIYGRMSSILDIGVGFHPELTGTENIYLSGELNGLTRKEIRKRMDEIIDFSGVEKFIDTPVKYYSSGMFLRLAFSVFTGIDSDILLLDEVMSVGDAEFQIKSARKLQSMFGQGKTIVLVSHNPADILKLCNRVLVLVEGNIKEDGLPGKILSDYLEESIIEAIPSVNKNRDSEKPVSKESTEPLPQEKPKLRSVVQWDDLPTAPGNEFFRLKRVEIRVDGKAKGEAFNIDDQLIIEITYWKKYKSDIIDVGLTLNHFGNIIFASSPMLTKTIDELTKKENVVTRLYIPPHLLNDTIYSIDIYAVKNRIDIFFQITNILHFIVKESYSSDVVRSMREKYPDYPGMIRPDMKWMILD